MVGGKKPHRIPETLEAYREKFKHAPLGRWHSFCDFGPFPTDTWEFYADGLGKIHSYSGSGEGITHFKWQPEAERTIKFCEVDLDKPLESDSADPPGYETENESMDWITIVYDFKIVEHYCPTVVMFQVPEGDTFKFWMTMDYLRFEGDIEA